MDVLVVTGGHFQCCPNKAPSKPPALPVSLVSIQLDSLKSRKVKCTRRHCHGYQNVLAETAGIVMPTAHRLWPLLLEPMWALTSCL